MIKIFDNKDLNTLTKINEFLDKNDFSEYNQTYSWSLVRNEKIKYYLYSEDQFSNIIWVCSLFEKDIDNTKVLLAPRGPIIDYTNKTSVDTFLSEISQWILDKGYQTLIMNPIIDYKHLENIDKGYNYEITSCNDYEKLFDSCKLAIMEIVMDSEELISKLPPKFRQNIRRSYRKDLTQKISKDIDLDNFYKLYLETSQRHEFKPHDISYFRNIIDTFKNDIVCFEVWYGDIPLAMSIDIVYKNRLIYLYGVSSSFNRNLLGMYNLQWEAIKYCIANNIPKYDFGGVFCEENDIDNKDYGLYKFKEGFCYDGFIDIVPDIKLNFKRKIK